MKLNLVHIPQRRLLNPKQIEEVLHTTWYIVNDCWIYISLDGTVAVLFRDSDYLAPDNGIQSLSIVNPMDKRYNESEQEFWTAAPALGQEEAE